MYASLVSRALVARPSPAPVAVSRSARVSRGFATASHKVTDDEVEALVAMTNPVSDAPSKLASAALNSARPSAVTITHYLDFLQEQKKFDQVSEFFDSYASKRKPNARMWTSVIRAACQAGNLTKALKYLDQWKSDVRLFPFDTRLCAFHLPI
jgi:pentatricopeptide repeat protein